MSTYEDRLAAVEQRIADIELERLYEKRKTAETTPAEQVYDIKQVNHRLTMLLGIASGQEHDIRTIKNDLATVKDDLATVKGDVATIKTQMGHFETLLTQVLARLPEKPE